MKILKISLITFIFSIFLLRSVSAEEYNIVASYKVNNLTFTSYSENWDEKKLIELYQELLENFHGDEINHLSAIYLYPDSPYAVNGYYYEDLIIDEYGKYVFGNNAYIEIFNADRYDTIQKIAPVLSHEYGHHYTISNISIYENKYYNEWENSEYIKIRNLKNYPVSYDGKTSHYKWDITEIAANDYVQLLGSKNAKLSTEYKDAIENLEADEKELIYFNDTFNIKPQANTEIPLAAEVIGLYEYMLKISGHTSKQFPITKKPVITSITETKTLLNASQYKITWSQALGKGPFEYTAVMYPKGNSFIPIPIKTVKDGSLEAVFGNAIKKNDDGTYSTILRNYEGEYEFRIFVKDRNNFIYSSEPVYYNFSLVYDDNYHQYNNYDNSNNINYNKTEEKNNNLLDFKNNNTINIQPNNALETTKNIININNKDNSKVHPLINRTFNEVFLSASKYINNNNIISPFFKKDNKNTYVSNNYKNYFTEYLSFCLKIKPIFNILIFTQY